jgi:hypothetical protein
MSQDHPPRGLSIDYILVDDPVIPSSAADDLSEWWENFRRNQAERREKDMARDKPDSLFSEKSS